MVAPTSSVQTDLAQKGLARKNFVPTDLVQKGLAHREFVHRGSVRMDSGHMQTAVPMSAPQLPMYQPLAWQVHHIGNFDKG